MAFKKGQSGNPAGKPKGTYTKPRFSDFLKEGDLDKVIAKALQMAIDGNEGMMKLVIEHSLGKPMQPVEGSFSGDLVLSFDKTFDVSSNTP